MLGHRSLKPGDYVAMAKRRAIWVIVPLFIFAVAAFGVSYFISPRYVSQTLVLIEQQKVPDDYVKPVVTSDLDDRLASMKEQILSRSRMQPIIEKYNLYPKLGMDEKLEETRKDIDIKPIRSEISRSNGLPGFFISFRASDPRTAQQVCGDITSLFVDASLKDRAQSAEGTTQFLESQLADAKSKLDTQDAKLADFQRKYSGRLPSEQGSNMNMMGSLNSQLDAVTQQISRMEQDKAYQESLLSQQQATLQTLQNQPKSAGVSIDERKTQLAAMEAEEAELTTRYTDSYPDVVSLRRKIADLKREMAKPPAPAPAAGGASTAATTTKGPEPVGIQQLRAAIRATDAGIAQKRGEQAQLQASMRQYQDRLQSSPEVEQEEKLLTRDYQQAQKFYDDLLNKMGQSKMASDLDRRQQGEQFRVMDEPNLPDSPSFPNRGAFGVGGAMLGLLLGLGVSALLEYRNTAIRTDEDVYAFLRLPTLGEVERFGTRPMTARSSPSTRTSEPVLKRKMLVPFRKRTVAATAEQH